MAVAERDAIADLLRRIVRVFAEGVAPGLVEQNRIRRSRVPRRDAGPPAAMPKTGGRIVFWVASIPRQPQSGWKGLSSLIIVPFRWQYFCGS